VHTLKPEIIVEVGANLGDFSLAAASVSPATERVVVFEPVEVLARLIELSVKENNLVSLIRVERVAVMDTTHSCDARNVSFGSTPQGLSIGSYAEHRIELTGGSGQQQVRATSLDCYFQRHPFSHDNKTILLKISVLGEGFNALRSGLWTISRARSVVVVLNVNRPYFTADTYFEAEEVYSLLNERNFRIFCIFQNRENTVSECNSFSQFHDAININEFFELMIMSDGVGVDLGVFTGSDPLLDDCIS
jgi:FkbM family methyltransferase